jgi:CubicO group peptidase (beta-lactamase class C family)
MTQVPRQRVHVAAQPLVSGLALLACSASPRGDTLSTPAPAAARDIAPALDGYFSGQFAADDPGGAVLVMKHDRVVFAAGYGLADLKTREPASTRTLFNVASVTKPFVASAILQLQEQGKLSVEDNLLAYFPAFKNKDIAARVLLKHLLTHTSGLPDLRNVRENVAFSLTANDAENWYPITQADALDFEPGSRFEYSNPAFDGLALIVEQVSGMKWQSFVREQIFLPARMTTSTITDGPHPESGVAHGYLKVRGEWAEADYGELPTFTAAGNGGVWSSVEELAHFELALRNGVFLRPATTADARTIKTFPSWTSATPPGLGYSWFIGQTPDHLRTIGHTGHQGGFTANYVTLPDKAIFFVTLSNSPRDIDAFAAKILNELKLANWLD